ncbi:MAG: hypothetical protein AMXMBFR46_03060 [Acidimicrobiia bacterium]
MNARSDDGIAGPSDHARPPEGDAAGPSVRGTVDRHRHGADLDDLVELDTRIEQHLDRLVDVYAADPRSTSPRWRPVVQSRNQAANSRSSRTWSREAPSCSGDQTFIAGRVAFGQRNAERGVVLDQLPAHRVVEGRTDASTAGSHRASRYSPSVRCDGVTCRPDRRSAVSRA